MFFIGTLSQTLTLRAAFASSTYLLPQIPGPACLNPPNPLFKGAHQGLRAFHRLMAALPANSGPASEDALLLLLDNGRTAVLPAANCEAPTDNQNHAEFKYITRVQRLHSDVIDSSNKVASVRTCLSQSTRPPFQGGDQGLRAFHRRDAIPARQLRPGI